MNGGIHRIFTKGVLVLLTTVYAVLSVGILQTTHFCMGRVSAVSYFSMDEKKCQCYAVLGEDMDCCDDEHALLQLDDDELVKTASISQSPLYFLLATLVRVADNDEWQAPKLRRLVLNHPPPPRENLYKIFCSFVFYGR